jgi:hypothetical protein
MPSSRLQCESAGNTDADVSPSSYIGSSWALTRGSSIAKRWRQSQHCGFVCSARTVNPARAIIRLARYIHHPCGGHSVVRHARGNAAKLNRTSIARLIPAQPIECACQVTHAGLLLQRVPHRVLDAANGVLDLARGLGRPGWSGWTIYLEMRQTPWEQHAFRPKL